MRVILTRFTLAFLLLSVAQLPAWTAAKEPDCTVLSVTDGDTIRVIFRGLEEPVRLLYIDTPESRDSHHGPATREGVIAKETVEQWLPRGSRVTLWTPHPDFRRDLYKRLLAVVLFEADGEDSVQRRLITNGLSVYSQKFNKLEMPPDHAWLHQDLLQCQETARTAMRGFWSVIPAWMAQKANELNGDPTEDFIQGVYGYSFVPDVKLAQTYLEQSSRGKSISEFQLEHAGPVTIPTLSLMVACYQEGRQTVKPRKIYPDAVNRCEELLRSIKKIADKFPKDSEAREPLRDFIALATGMMSNIGKYGQPSKGSWEKLDRSLAQLAKFNEPGQAPEAMEAFVLASATARILRFCMVARLGGDIPQVVP